MSAYPKAYGRYILEDRIAMGGMAEIFRARTATAGFEKRVCIKRILPHFLEDEEFVTMFRDEARTAAKLQHANVVQVFDFGTEEGALYLAMELVDGADLRRILEASRKKRIAFEIGEAVQIAIDMCKGLHHAHTLVENGKPLGLVHRDISPHNVMVSKAGEVKVTDFGIAKAAERATHTSTGIVKGKVSYMAPEQAQGFHFDHRLDQFAAGIVLWEMLTGTRLFTGETDVVILKKVLACEIPPPSGVRKSLSADASALPASLDAIVLKALSVDPDDRYADMRQMELALSRFMFSGAIDPSTAEVRNVFPRIMADAEPALRKTQVADAKSLLPSLESLVTPPDIAARDLDHVSQTESQSMVESSSSPDGSAERSVVEGSVRSRSDVSMVFSSSEKLPPAPGPSPEGPRPVDPNAVTMMEMSEESLRAEDPILSPASSGKNVPAREAGLPSMAELSRLDDASEALKPAADATPATRTNVPRGEGSAAVVSDALAAALPVTTSPVPMTASRPAIAVVTDDIVAVPRARGPRAAAAAIVVTLGASALVFAFTRDAPALAPLAIAEPRAPGESARVAPDESAPAALDESAPVAPDDSAAAAIEKPVETKPDAPLDAKLTAAVVVKPVDAKSDAIDVKPAEAKPKKAQRVQVLVKATGRWVYFVPSGGEKVEIYSGGTPMKLPEGKGKFKLITQEGKTVFVPLEVIAGKTLLLPAM